MLVKNDLPHEYVCECEGCECVCDDETVQAEAENVGKMIRERRLFEDDHDIDYGDTKDIEI